MPISSYIPVYGRILRITNPRGDCCQKMLSLLTDNGTITIILTPDTFVADTIRLRVGMQIVAFYDGNVPVPLIFPPQYRAVIITGRRGNETVMVSYFDPNLLSDDGNLRLNVGPSTEISTANGQPFRCSPADRTLIVYYTAVTRSIPPQTTPRRIIVLC